jgi:pyruvate ferredoxin oxidoreductase gamma subunit/2-oxoisovalerate ferredoxin oxidoreductase gamma subunit
VIRFYGRGGQGTVTAAELLARAALYDGKYATSVGRFGAERRGAPVAVYLRLSDEPITVKSFPRSWGFIIVADPKIEMMLDVTEGFDPGGVAVMNTKKGPGEVRLNVRPSRVGAVDATGISLSVFGPRAIPITSTAMISAFAKTTGLVSLGSLVRSVGEEWSGRVAELNVEAMNRAYDQTQVLDLGGGGKT